MTSFYPLSYHNRDTLWSDNGAETLSTTSKSVTDVAFFFLTVNMKCFVALDSSLCCNLFKDTCHKCQEGWEQNGPQCYYFSIDKLTWKQAREKCRRDGADLVKIESEDEQVEHTAAASFSSLAFVLSCRVFALLNMIKVMSHRHIEFFVNVLCPVIPDAETERQDDRAWGQVLDRTDRLSDRGHMVVDRRDTTEQEVWPANRFLMFAKSKSQV